MKRPRTLPGRRLLPTLIALGLIASGSWPLRAGEIPIGSGPAGLSVAVTSMKESRFSRTVRQAYDFSCGSAALATLLSFHYQRPSEEEPVFLDMWERGDREQIRQQGFSFLDLRDALLRRGLGAEGYRVSLDQLAEARIPAIALIELDGYRHFVVIQGVSREQVLFADPSRGVRSMPRAEFDAIRDPVTLVVRNPLPEPSGLLRLEFQVQPPAPIELTRRASPSDQIGLLRRAPNEF